MVQDRALDDIVKDNRKKRQNKMNNQRNQGQRNQGQRQGRGQGQRRGNFNNRMNQNFNNRRNQSNNRNFNNNNRVMRGNNRAMRGGNRNFQNGGQMMKFNNNRNNSPRFNNNNFVQKRNFNNNNNNPRANQFRNAVKSFNNRTRPNFNNRRNPQQLNRGWQNRNRMVQKNRPVGRSPVAQRPVRGLMSRTSRMNAQKKANGPVQLHVANLHFKVSEKDMRELFGEFGKLTKVSLHYDKNGKPQGSCDINFAQKSDAIRALKKYNKVPLDGRPMAIKIVEDLSPKPATRVVVKTVPVPVRAKPQLARGPMRGPMRNTRAPMNRKQMMMQRVRKSITRANKVKNTKMIIKKSKPSPAKKTDNKKGKLTEEDLDKQLDAYLSAGAL